jgi:hypothetical protein
MSGDNRRDVLRVGLSAVAAGATASWLLPTGSAFAGQAVRQVPRRRFGAAAAAVAAPFTAYSADSFFRASIAGAPVDAVRTALFRTFMKTFGAQKSCAFPVINGVGSNKWGTAYAMGASTDPIWKLTGSVPSAVSILKTQGFHAPEWFGAMLSGTTDSPFVVIDRGSGISVWAAKAAVSGPHTVSVGAAGYFEHGSNGLDKRNPKSDSKVNFRSRGAIPDALVIRRDLVDAGIANGTGLGHVLHMFIAETRSADGYCSPMVGCEGNQLGWGAEGERVAIAPSVDLTKRGLSPAGLVVARTLQENGAYIGDNAGTGTALKAEQTSSARDVWKGLLSQNALQGITWDDFVVLPHGWQ